MAIDRANRDLLAEALAEFMRGDIDESTFYERLKPIEPLFDYEESGNETGDRMISQVGTQLLYVEGVYLPGARRETWDRLTRYLAFLDTDREYEPKPLDNSPGPGPGPLDDPRRYRWHALGFVVSFIIMFIEDTWWPVASWWVISFVWLFVIGNIQDGRRRNEWLERNPPPPDFSPFRDEADWHANSHRVNRFRLPPFDPENPWPPQRKTGWGSKLIGYTFGAAAVVALILFGLAMIFIFWPFSVLMGCFDRDEFAHGEENADAAKR